MDRRKFIAGSAALAALPVLPVATEPRTAVSTIALTAGMPLRFKPVNANVGVVTLKVGDGPTRLLRKADGSPLVAGDLKAGRWHTVSLG